MSQVIAQAFSLAHQIEQAYKTVRIAPEILASTSRQISNLRDILRDVESEPTLHTAAIYTQLDIINETAMELKKMLDKMAVLQRKSTLRQGLRALIRRTEDETRLRCVLEWLEQAKTDLLLRVNVVHVGITRRATETPVQGPPTPSAKDRGEDVGLTSDSRCLIIGRNETHDEADQLNGIGGFNIPTCKVTARVVDNRAIEKSRQRNFILAGTSPLPFL